MIDHKSNAFTENNLCADISFLGLRISRLFYMKMNDLGYAIKKLSKAIVK